MLTQATSIAYSACIQLSYHYGLGRHYCEQRPSIEAAQEVIADNPVVYVDMTKALDLVKWAYICQVFCILTPLVGRISVFLYTLSLLGKTKRSLRYSLWMLLFLQVIFNVSIALTLLGVCGTDFHVIAK